MPATQPADRLTGLATRAAGGDTEAMGALLTALAPSILRSARALLGPTHADADDVVQQSLIAVVQAMPAFRGDCTPTHYALRITARIAMAARRRTLLKAERSGDEEELLAVVSDAPDAMELALAERRRTLLRRLMDSLPEEQAETLALRVVLGFSLPEVAAATGAPINTVRSRVRLAKEALRRAIEGDPMLADALEVE